MTLAPEKVATPKLKLLASCTGDALCDNDIAANRKFTSRDDEEITQLKPRLLLRHTFFSVARDDAKKTVATRDQKNNASNRAEKGC